MKKRISTMLAVCLVLLGLLPFFNQSYALTMYKEVTKYHLDMGVIHIWGNGDDKNNATYQYGLTYNTSKPFSASLSFPEEIVRVDKAYVLKPAEFQWDNFPTYTYNGTDYLNGKTSFDSFYSDFVSNNISNIKPTLSGTHTVNLSYTALLKSRVDYDLSGKLNSGGYDTIIALLGGEGSVKPDLEAKLKDGRDHGVAPGVFGFMFFVPIVIEYTVMEPVPLNPGDFTADLDVPTSAKPGDKYNVVDKSAFYDTSEFACTQLSYKVDSGSPKAVTGWKGSSLGESIQQSFANECSVTYTITTWNKYGDSKTASKTINISNDHAIEINPSLNLPSFTYEGHKEIAKDESTFKVDGVDRSAAYMYAQGLADNSFRADSSTVSLNRLTDTQENCTFSNQGTYNIELRISADGGGRATDSKSIEVRKTPYIEDTLTGFQKQNRKQILTAKVATYPGKPLTNYSITLKDKKTGDYVILTPGNPQQNTSTIKTRIVTMTQDLENGFAYITVEFLTKTPSYFSTGTNTQDFYYQIDVTDSKGDTDTKSKTFTVSPDLPPTPAISLDSAFLRNEGTNIATIKAEDVTIAKDGDSVARTWYYGATTAPSVYTDVSTMAGYQKLSFGTDKIVGFNTVGVGKFTTKLFVKEVWTEPTLEEYVTDSDHLTGTVTAFSDVQNVAPIVSLELLNGIQKDVLLIANNDTEYQTLFNNKTALKQALLANKIDANIVIKKLIGSTPSDVTGIKQKISYTFPTTYWHNNETDRNAMIADSEKTYFTTWTMVSNTGYTTPVTVHAYNPYSGEVWSYTSSDPEVFSFNQDDTGKYLYLVYSNHTVILDKKTGTVAGNIGMALTGGLFVTDNLFFSLEGTTLYAIDQNTLQKTTVNTNVYAVARVGANIQYITRADLGVVRNTLNINDLSITRDLLINTSNGVGSADDYVPACIDSAGKVILYKNTGAGTDNFSGVRVYSSDNKMLIQIGYTKGYYYSFSSVYAPLDENGECHHAIAQFIDTSTKPDTNAFIGFNLDNGSSSYFGVRSNSMGGFVAFESGGTTHMYTPGWYLTGGTDYWGGGFVITYNGSSISGNSGGIITSSDESYAASDRMIASWWGDNSLVATLKFQISVFPKTLAQETKELLGKYSNKFTFVGGTSTTADQIKASVDAAKPVVKVTANNDGYLSLNNLTLIPGKKYYYDYDIKPLTSGTKEKLSGISTTTPTSTSDQIFGSDTLYVTDSYEEKFNGGPINPFFTVNDPGTIADGLSSDPNVTGYGAYGGGSDSDGYAKLSFTVPAGKQAIVTLDYHLNYSDYTSSSYPNGIYNTANVLVDGKPFRDKFLYGGIVEDATNATFYKLLDSGVHTIECSTGGARTGYWEWVLMDNLKVDILSTTPKTILPTYGINSSDDEGWYDIDGTFNIPPRTISYGSQASYTYYGGMPAEVTQYDTNGYASAFNFYQTVPAGYLQKGRVHYVVYYMRSNATISINGARQLTGVKTGASDWLMFSSPITAGTYTHTLKYGSKSSSNSASLDILDTVTYPDNAVTETQNMAFNSSNTEYFFPKVSSTGNTSLYMFIPKGEYLIKNLRVYYMQDGQKIYLENKALDDTTQLPSWTLSSGLTASNATNVEKKNDDEFVKIYKKGEKVLYNIFYDDYEKDPSKTGYWVYTHVPWPPDTIHPDVGKVLTAPIDRFYLSGKYTVTHWEVDNTQRPSTVGDSTPYNKESNRVTMTFYVDGEGKAPWITYIKTTPAMVEYGDSYTIQVGVDDSEKDALALETSVYLNGVLIKTDNKTGIIADASGNYPEQNITGLPKAAKGTYQVICTVSDYSGTGLKSYKFTVKGVSASATVDATASLKSGYGIWSTVKTVTENCTASKVTAGLPSGGTVNMVCTGGSGDSLTWQFPANTGTYAVMYNKKYNIVSRQVFVPVKWPDDTYYTITYNVYDSSGNLIAQAASKTYINGNMYDDDYTVKSE